MPCHTTKRAGLSERGVNIEWKPRFVSDDEYLTDKTMFPISSLVAEDKTNEYLVAKTFIIVDTEQAYRRFLFV
jgi:hypothetical protein